MQKCIKDIISGIKITSVKGDLNKQVTGISYNSKTVLPGNVFVCLKGEHTSGVNFINEAIHNGASCIIADVEISGISNDIPVVIVEDVQLALGQISTNFYDNPSQKMLMIGVTGTNGKTTVTYVLESIFNFAGYKPGVIGTINYRYKDKILPAPNTTPFACDLQKILYEMYNSGVDVIIMEVSSHSLVQRRVAGCEFDVAIFTNLSKEHLDFHKTMENYFAAKSLLFKEMKDTKKDIFKNQSLGNKTCVINIDDEWGKKMLSLSGINNNLTYGKDKSSKFRFNTVKQNLAKTQFEIIFNSKRVKVTSPLIGEYNIYNAVASFVASYSQGVEIEHILQGIENVSPIPGRLEVLKLPVEFSVVIDYAHTPDALEKVLMTLNTLPHRRLILVFGCGGDRDRSKRPIMGSIGVNLADYVILTSDNPRTEDPRRIILDIEVGIKRTNKTNYEIIVDRREAIYRALKLANSGDIILLAGKGHENYQIIGENKIHFDEREIVTDFLRSLCKI